MKTFRTYNTPNLREQFRGYTSKKYRRLNIREHSKSRARAFAATVSSMKENRNFTGTSSRARRDLTIRTHHTHACGIKGLHIREVRDNSLKLAARRRHRRREALKRIDVIVHFLRTLPSASNGLAYKSGVISIYIPCVRQDICKFAGSRRSRGCINSIRPPVSDGKPAMLFA